MLTNLYFVRHAHSTYSSDELKRPLSVKGFHDAEIITEVLKNEKIDIVISSPYLRAIQTVEGISKFIKKDIEIINELRERKLSENPVEDFNYSISRVWEEPTLSLEGGESNVSAQGRGVKATIQLIEKYEGKNIVIGTHGNIMVLIMNHFDNTYDFDFWKKLNMPDIYKLTFQRNDLKDVSKISYRI